jgi:hypothetical protein
MTSQVMSAPRIGVVIANRPACDNSLGAGPRTSLMSVIKE